MALFFFIFCAICVIAVWLLISYTAHGLMHSDIPVVKYQISGNKDGQPLVFLHGWPDLPHVWSEQIAHFKETYLCINLELPNFNQDFHCTGNPWGYDIPNVVSGVANQITYLL